jgi:hypothetical protein
VRAYKNSNVQSQKMLASTVQFSTTNQHVRSPDPTSPPPPQGWQRYETQTGPGLETTRTPAEAARSLRTQQRAYNPRATNDPVPRTPEGMPYCGPTDAGGRTGQRSTLEHHPEHSVARR